MTDSAVFLSKYDEKADFNQYWYSSFTIKKMVEEIVRVGGKVGFLSTPSLYFSLPEETRKLCFVFDYDDCWSNDRGFVHYDFNLPEEVDSSMLHTFDMVVIDPPFITHEVWRKYGVTAKLLLKEGTDNDGNTLGKAILTTVFENKDLLFELFQATPTVFQPSIPNLVYQYTLYTNYPALVFQQRNPEIPE